MARQRKGYGGDPAVWNLVRDYDRCNVETKPDECGYADGGSVTRTLVDGKGRPVCMFVRTCDDNGNIVEDVVSVKRVWLYEPYDGNSPVALRTDYGVLGYPSWGDELYAWEEEEREIEEGEDF